MHSPAGGCATLQAWQLLAYFGRYGVVRLKEAMLLRLANDASFGLEWLDHALKGERPDHRECRISAVFLPIYQGEANGSSFVRFGTHAELFGN